MTVPLKPGDVVQTPLGKGVVSEIRNNGRLAVDVGGRSVLFDADALSRVAPPKTPRTIRKTDVGSASRRAEPPPAPAPAGEIDLHGLTVDEALARADEAINAALLRDMPELRLIHGRRGSRIRDALHRRLRNLPVVRTFALDPQNPGATIVRL